MALRPDRLNKYRIIDDHNGALVETFIETILPTDAKRSNAWGYDYAASVAGIERTFEVKSKLQPYGKTYQNLIKGNILLINTEQIVKGAVTKPWYIIVDDATNKDLNQDDKNLRPSFEIVPFDKVFVASYDEMMAAPFVIHSGSRYDHRTGKTVVVDKRVVALDGLPQLKSFTRQSLLNILKKEAVNG